MFGQLIHRYPRPKWGEVKEPSPIVGQGVVIGMGATLIGGIRVGDNVYIAAGAIVTKYVPKDSIVLPHSSENIPISEWKGRMQC